MGVPDAPEYTLDDNLSFQKYKITFEDALVKGIREQARFEVDHCKKTGMRRVP